MQVLPPVEATQALEGVPEFSTDWVEKAFDAVEQIGLKRGRNLLEQHSKSSQQSTPTTTAPQPRSPEPRHKGT